LSLVVQAEELSVKGMPTWWGGGKRWLMRARRADVAWAREIKEREEREREEKERGRLRSQCTIPLLQIGGPPK
jgi:hypothetical protein